jgi:hypothetical protein
MKTLKCKTIAWINKTPPLREIELDEAEANRLASGGYLQIIGEVEATSSPAGEIESGEVKAVESSGEVEAAFDPPQSRRTGRRATEPRRGGDADAGVVGVGE